MTSIYRPWIVAALCVCVSALTFRVGASDDRFLAWYALVVSFFAGIQGTLRLLSSGASQEKKEEEEP